MAEQEKQYTIRCWDNKHDYVLGRSEMVKLFGEEKITQLDAGTLDMPLYAPSCMECVEEDELSDEIMDHELHELGLAMSAHDS